MAIAPGLQQQSFNAEQVRAMAVAFDHACKSLGLTDTSDRLTEIIAAKVIEAARDGETDAERLYEAVMHWASAA